MLRVFPSLRRARSARTLAAISGLDSMTAEWLDTTMDVSIFLIRIPAFQRDSFVHFIWITRAAFGLPLTTEALRARMTLAFGNRSSSAIQRSMVLAATMPLA